MDEENDRAKDLSKSGTTANDKRSGAKAKSVLHPRKTRHSL